MTLGMGGEETHVKVLSSGHPKSGYYGNQCLLNPVGPQSLSFCRSKDRRQMQEPGVVGEGSLQLPSGPEAAGGL